MIEVDFAAEKPLAGTRKARPNAGIFATCAEEWSSHVSWAGEPERPFDVFLRYLRFMLDHRVTCPKIDAIVV